MLKTIATVLALSLGLCAANADEEFEIEYKKAKSQVAASFDPGPSIVMRVLGKVTYYGYIDLCINLTGLTEYEVPDILFGGENTSSKNTMKGLAQFIAVRDIRQYFANPVNLQSVYGQVKSVAVPALLQKVGPTRANTWLAPAEVLFAKNGFNPSHGKIYEDWRTGGCQWHLQVSPDSGYTPKLPKNECAKHPFVAAMRADKQDLLNRAHWYGFLWRRYLEGDTGLVAVWQGILSDIAKAARPQSAGRS